eukprot:148065_1
MLYSTAVFALLICYVVAFQFDIPITNPSFEIDDYPLPDNTYHWWQNQDVTGWTRYDPEDVMASWSTGVMNPTGGTAYHDPIYGSAPPDGLHIIYIEPAKSQNENKGELGVEQELTAKVEANTTYTLSAFVGNIDDNTFSATTTDPNESTSNRAGFPGYKLMLLAADDSDIVLAEDDDSNPPSDGEWSFCSTQAIINGDNPNIDKPLKIRLVHKNSGKNQGFEIDFDGVSLIAEPHHTRAPTTVTTEPTRMPTSLTTAPTTLTIQPTNHPTKSPTNPPSTPPSIAPSRQPSSSPTTKSPTTQPSHGPTAVPSVQPTTAPSGQPTALPSVSPSEQPTQQPTRSPSLMPTNQPSTTPTITPTAQPSVTPSVSPSLACRPQLHYTASWSESYLSIQVRIKNTNDELQIQPSSKKIKCVKTFDQHTNTLIGDDATCVAVVQDVNDLLFVIDLSSTSAIDLNDIITIQRTAIQSICTGRPDLVDLHLDLVISSISHPLQPSAPNIIISKLSTVIGVCDDLVLDARSTTNVGGRDNALFVWKVSMEGNVYSYTGSNIVIGSESLTKGETYHIVLDVTNWYGAVSSTAFQVDVSNDATPSVFIRGITEYSTTDLNLNGFVDMIAEVTFDDSCLNEAVNVRLEYEISWTVSQRIVNENDAVTTNEDTFQKLTESLQLETQETLSIDALVLLQSGFLYTFTVNIKCIGDYACDVDATHQVTFHVAPIHCMIMTNDITLDSVDPEHDLDFTIELDGDTFTYDPDSVDSSGLLWSWNCMDDTDQSCDYLLDSLDSGVIAVDLSATIFEYDSDYSFTIAMTIADTIQVYRDECFDAFTLQINTKKEADTHELHVKSLIVTVTSISTEITKNDRLRLLGNVINYQIEDLMNEGVVTYEWKEAYEVLSDEDIAIYKETSTDNAMNLILREDVLISGETYSFQLYVTQYDAEDMQNVIGYGVSQPVSIYILNEPKIFDGSFQMDPPCDAVEYESILELLSAPYSLSLSADGAHTPLLYVFGYEEEDEMYYFDSSNMYEPSLSNVYLPIGDFNIFVDVSDAKSSTISDHMTCSVSLKSNAICLDLATDIIEPYFASNPVISSSAITSYILGQSIHYLQYLYQHYEEETDADTCIEMSLQSVLDIIYQYTSNAEFCGHHSRSISILLSEAVTMWMRLVITNPSFIAILTQTNSNGDTWSTFDTLENILIEVLDPCLYTIHDRSLVESFHVSQQSLVTNIPKIYHDTTDVTNNLSPLTTHPNDHPILYSLASAMIALFRTLPSTQYITLYNLLSDALYISELVRISLSIPFESTFTEFDDFTLYSARVKNEDVQVSVADIDVSIPQAVTNTGTDLLDSVDVLIIALNSTPNEADTSISSNSKCDSFTGTLSDNTVSVVVMGNRTNTSQLSSNINLTFTCNALEGCDDSFECAWYNKHTEVWQNEGCSTEIHYDTNNIDCSCNHLTTFATIHNIHSDQCEPNEFIDEWLSSDAWNVVNISVFVFICVVVMRDLYPFYVRHAKRKVTFQTHRSVYAVILIGLSSFLYVIVYIIEFLTKLSIQQNGASMRTDIWIKLYSLSLLLPQVTLFLLFSLIFYTWFVLAHSFMQNIDDVKRRIRYAIVVVNLLIWCFLIVYYVLIWSRNHHIFEVAAYIWSGMLSITAIFITVYSILVGKVLYDAARISQNQNFAQQDWTVVRRLLIINTFLTLYFAFCAFTTIYLAVNPGHQTVIHSSLYSLMDALCLLVIFWMYRDSLQRLKVEDALTLARVKSNTSGSTTWRGRDRAQVKSNTAKSPSTSTLPVTPATPDENDKDKITYKDIKYGSNLHSNNKGNKDADVEIVYGDNQCDPNDDHEESIGNMMSSTITPACNDVEMITLPKMCMVRTHSQEMEARF